VPQQEYGILQYGFSVQHFAYRIDDARLVCLNFFLSQSCDEVACIQNSNHSHDELL
jgi:hypothetical protein